MVTLIIHTLATLIFLSLLTQYSCKNYVEEACNATRYRDLCIHSLSAFSNTAKQDPLKWARAGVSVNIGEAKSVSGFLIKLKNRKAVKGGRNKVALADCIECIQDSLDNLHKSLYVLRKLSAKTFDSQMGDVSTWVSAALTDEGTCLDGFDGGPKGRHVKLLQNRVKNVSYFTSNALALVAKLATAGPENSYGP